MKTVSLNFIDSNVPVKSTTRDEKPKFGRIFEETPKPEFSHKVKIQHGRMTTCD